jgi:hypothetical protein
MAGVKISFAPALLCLALASDVLAVPSAQPKTPEAAPIAPDPVQVEVRAPKDRYLGGEPVIISVVLRNNTNKPVSFLMLGPKYEFAVRNNLNSKRGKGRLVGLVAKGRDDSTGEKVAEHVVEPSGEWKYEIVLSRLFDLSRAGTYTVSGHKNLKLENPAPGGSLVGANKLARDVKIVVLDGDVSDTK